MKYKISLLLLLLLLIPSCFIRLVNPPPEPTEPAVKGKSRKPPLPPIMMQFIDPAQQMMAPEIVRELVPAHDFDIVDQRITNGLGSLTFYWTEPPNSQGDLAGYYFYHETDLYTNKTAIPKDTYSYRLENLSRTIQHRFALLAFNLAGEEGSYATNRPFWPNPPIPFYTNFVVIVPYRFATNVNGPWMDHTARLHYVSLPEGTTLFWKSLPLSIEKVP